MVLHMLASRLAAKDFCLSMHRLMARPPTAQEQHSERDCLCCDRERKSPWLKGQILEQNLHALAHKPSKARFNIVK
jgi:hypothetical protein